MRALTDGTTYHSRARAMSWLGPGAASVVSAVTPGKVNPETPVVEEGGTATCTVVLVSRRTARVTVDSSGAGDVSVDPASLTFTTSNWYAPQEVTVRARHADDDDNEAVTLLHAMPSTDSVCNQQDAASVGAKVRDDDAEAGVSLSHSASNPLEVPEAGGARPTPWCSTSGRLPDLGRERSSAGRLHR